MQNVAEAIEEVNLIKRVIDRTQNDFSRIASFFYFYWCYQHSDILNVCYPVPNHKRDGACRIFILDAFQGA